MILSRIVLLSALLVMVQAASAASYRIDFSGTFSDNCIDCGAYDTGDLRGTDFSGYIIIPDSGVAEPGEYYRGETVYRFDSSQAYFELDAADDRFDFSSNLAMNAYVFDGDCIYSCQDRFALYFYTDDWFFDVGFARNTATDPMTGEEMPTLTELQQLTLADDGSFTVSNSFSVGAPPFDGWVANYDMNDPDSYNILNVSVAAIPLPPALALFPAALLVLARFRRQ